MQKDLTYGEDVRGDHALFIERSHFQKNGWELDEEAYEFTKNKSATFFRVIEDGEEQSSHGWIEEGKVVQWG